MRGDDYCSMGGILVLLNRLREQSRVMYENEMKFEAMESENMSAYYAGQRSGLDYAATLLQILIETDNASNERNIQK